MSSSMIARHIEKLIQLQKQKVEAGWFGGAFYVKSDGSQGLPVATVAAINEMGTDKIPPRPFMREAWASFRRDAIGIIASTTFDVLRGKTKVFDYFEAIGDSLVERVADSLENGNWAPNSPYTIAKKGSDQPLIDTRLMLQTLERRIS